MTPPPMRGRIACSNCQLGSLCLGCDAASPTMAALHSMVRSGTLVPSGSVLYRAGDAFGALYAIRSGFVKTSIISPDGSEQVVAFHLPGDIIGLDAIHDGIHHTTASALGGVAVCAIPYGPLVELAAADSALQRRLLTLMSRSIAASIRRPGDASADRRIADFLLDLARSFYRRGYSSKCFILPMPRRDIANYLGLATETVSRVLTRFQQDGLIRVTRREIEVLDRDELAAA